MYNLAMYPKSEYLYLEWNDHTVEIVVFYIYEETDYGDVRLKIEDLNIISVDDKEDVPENVADLLRDIIYEFCYEIIEEELESKLNEIWH